MTTAPDLADDLSAGTELQPVDDAMLVNLAMAGERLQVGIVREVNRQTGRESDTKTLRTMTAKEAARLVGISDKHLREVAKSAGMEVRSRDGRNVGWSLRDVNDARQRLFDRTGKEEYRVGRRPGERPLRICVANFKGGSGKTTTAVHLAQFLALQGFQVLFVDLDPQATGTAMFGLSPDFDIAESETAYPLFGSGGTQGLQTLIAGTCWPTIDIVPATLGLQQADVEAYLRAQKDPTFQFWGIMDRHLQTVEHDVVVLDTMPHLGPLTLNACIAADLLLVPSPASLVDLHSTFRFLLMLGQTLGRLRESGMPPKVFSAFRVIATRFDVGVPGQASVMDWYRHIFGGLMARQAMITTSALDAAGSTRRTLYEIGAADVSRATLLRALDAMDGVGGEVRGLMNALWERRA